MHGIDASVSAVEYRLDPCISDLMKLSNSFDNASMPMGGTPMLLFSVDDQPRCDSRKAGDRELACHADQADRSLKAQRLYRPG